MTKDLIQILILLGWSKTAIDQVRELARAIDEAQR